MFSVSDKILLFLISIVAKGISRIYLLHLLLNQIHLSYEKTLNVLNLNQILSIYAIPEVHSYIDCA